MTKHTLIFGGGSAIGKSLAYLLKEEDELVSTLSRNPEGENSFFADASKRDPLPDIPGSFSGLVYLPGTIRLKPFDSLSLEDFLEDLEINYLGAVRFCKKYKKQLEKGGSIVFVSSIAATIGLPYHTSIAGAKGALESFAKALAADIAPNGRVNVVSPSLSDTPLAKDLLSSEEKKAASAKRHPLQRIGSSKDIAQAISYLLSDKSSWVSGQVLAVDGGLSTLKML